MADELVTIFGATGYTGRLCARRAVDAGLRVRLAGRRQAALATLAADLGGAVETAVADAHDAAALRALAETSAVLVSTAGPYADLGPPVVEAALGAGTAYLDVSAEVRFLDWVYEQGRRAEATGAVLCPGFGVDGVPGELLAALCAAELGGAVTQVRVGYLARRAVPTAGTARSALEVAEHGGLALAGGVLVREPAFAVAWTLPFPHPLGPQPGVSVPLPEVVTVGRSLGATSVRTFAAVPDLPGSALVAGLLGRGVGALARTPVWKLPRAAAQRLPDGPPEELRAAARLAVVAEVTGARGSARAWCRLRDVYGTTAKVVVAAARRLLEGGVDAGARTPSEVAGDAGGFLEEIGARWARLPS